MKSIAKFLNCYLLNHYFNREWNKDFEMYFFTGWWGNYGKYEKRYMSLANFCRDCGLKE